MNTKLSPSLGEEDDIPIVWTHVLPDLLTVHLTDKKVSSFLHLRNPDNKGKRASSIKQHEESKNSVGPAVIGHFGDRVMTVCC